MSERVSNTFLSASLLDQVTTCYCTSLLLATNKQLADDLNTRWIRTQSPEKGTIVCTSLSICCQRKDRFEANIKARGASELEHLLF